MSNNNLWWSFDADNNSISALPAGPMLLPALGVFALVAAIQAVRGIDWFEDKPSCHMLNSESYKRDALRYRALLQKRIDFVNGLGDDWDYRDYAEVRNLEFPGWNQGRQHGYGL